MQFLCYIKHRFPQESSKNLKSIKVPQCLYNLFLAQSIRLKPQNQDNHELHCTNTASGRMRCNRAAEDSTRSHSGQVSFGIMLPEMITLGIGIRDMRLANIHPVQPLTASNAIINSRQDPLFMI